MGERGGKSCAIDWVVSWSQLKELINSYMDECSARRVGLAIICLSAFARIDNLGGMVIVLCILH